MYKSGEHDGGLVVVPKSIHMIDKAFVNYDDIFSLCWPFFTKLLQFLIDVRYIYAQKQRMIL